MLDRSKQVVMDDLPVHLIFEILASGRLSAEDLVSLELTSKTFRENGGFYPREFGSFVDFVAFRLCVSHPTYASMPENAQIDIFNRCDRIWKRLLRFLQLLENSSDMVQTSSGKMQIMSGRYHTLLIRDKKVYSCGSSLCGVLGHGSETTQSVAFMPISFLYPVEVIQVSASHNHAAFVTRSGEVFTCGDNSSFCCGHKDTSRPIFRPKLVEALKSTPCKQVSVGLSFTIFLTRNGDMYTCGINTHGQLGHGDTVDRSSPKKVEFFRSVSSIVHISAGSSYSLAISTDGTLFSFGSGTNFCLGHGTQNNELEPRVVQSFKRKNVHIVRASAGDEHIVALDSCGYVHTWGKGYCGALGHGDEIDKTTPQLLTSLTSHVAIQVCASKRKTFILIEDGSVYAFGWMGFGSLGFSDRDLSEKVLNRNVLNSLKSHHISQVSTGLYHTVVLTRQGKVLGFGDNERGQLGHETLRFCLQPTEIFS